MYHLQIQSIYITLQFYCITTTTLSQLIPKSKKKLKDESSLISRIRLLLGYNTNNFTDSVALSLNYHQLNELYYLLISCFTYIGDYDYGMKKRNLSKHVGNFFCPNNCGRSYKYKWNLNQHLRYECGQEKQFKCNKCNKCFTQKVSLKSHLINIHKSLE